MDQYTREKNASFRRSRKQLSAYLRKNQTAAEKELWKILRRNQLEGFRFRRQHPLSGYIVDFYCPELKLAIEVDGSIHDSIADSDAARDCHLRTLGYSVLRIRNEEVSLNQENLMRFLKNYVHQLRDTTIGSD